MPERSRYITDSVIELQVPVSEEIFNTLKRAQELICQKQSKRVSLEEVIRVLAESYLIKEDPLAREARRTIKKERLQNQKTDNQNSASQNQVLPRPGEVTKAKPPAQTLKRTSIDKILTRDHSQCTHLDDKSTRCQETKWLQVHHVIPKSNGGSNDPYNVRTLCFGHHKIMHEH